MINEHEQNQLNGLLEVFNKKSSKKYKNDPNLEGKRRIFNQELLEKFDIPARNIIKEKLGDFVIDNPDEFQQDLVIKGDCKYKFLEIQVVSQWITDIYPYDKLYLYERKAKYNNDTLFLTLNRKFTVGYLFSRKCIDTTKKPRRLFKYSRECVYDVPWNMTLKVDIETLTPDVINCY